MTPEKIRGIPLPFVETKIGANMSQDAVSTSIAAIQLVFLREIAAQLAELNTEITLLKRAVDSHADRGMPI